jgi:hypothetical protein
LQHLHCLLDVSLLLLASTLQPVLFSRLQQIGVRLHDLLLLAIRLVGISRLHFEQELLPLGAVFSTLQLFGKTLDGLHHGLVLALFEIELALVLLFGVFAQTS